MRASTTLNVARLFFLLLSAFIGATVAMGEAAEKWWIGSLLGFLFAALVIALDSSLRNLSLRTFSHAIFGLLIGLLGSWLVTRIVFLQGRWVEQFELAGSIFSLGAYLGFGFIGVMLALRSKGEEFSLLIPYVRFRQDALHELPTLLDTSVIIDGRVPGIRAAGFLGGTLTVPRFVLDELQRLAESSDELERSRGARGLACLDGLRNTEGLDLSIRDEPLPTDSGLEGRMVAMAEQMNARILTNDSQLTTVAALKGVSVLHLSQLALALRPFLSPGDEVELELVKQGKDEHQAVGYLPDGTMIVVNHARDHIGKIKPIIISGAVQTSAGRLIFAELKP